MAKSKTFPESSIRDLFPSGDGPVEPTPTLQQPEPLGAGSSKRPKQDSGQTRYLTVQDVARRYSMGVSTVWRWVEKNPHFPQPIKLSEGTSRWLENDLLNFEASASLRRSTSTSPIGTKPRTRMRSKSS